MGIIILNTIFFVLFILSLWVLWNFYTEKKELIKRDGIIKVSQSAGFKVNISFFYSLLITFVIGLAIFNPGGGSKEDNSVDIYNDQVLTQHLQGKWEGSVYTHIGENIKWDVRFLIEGENITIWQNISDSGRNWSDAIGDEDTYTISYIKKKGESRRVFFTNNNLRPDIYIMESGNFLYDGHNFNRGWTN